MVSLRSLRYRCTWEVARYSRDKPSLCRNHPRAFITRRKHANHETIVKYSMLEAGITTGWRTKHERGNKLTRLTRSCRVDRTVKQSAVLYFPLLFKFHTLYEFWFSDWLICATWHWVMTKQPPWRHYRGVNSIHHSLYTMACLYLVYGCFSVVFLCVFNLNNKKTHSLLVDYRDLPALVH